MNFEFEPYRKKKWQNDVPTDSPRTRRRATITPFAIELNRNSKL
jgi:hypothetical protein